MSNQKGNLFLFPFTSSKSKNHNATQNKYIHLYSVRIYITTPSQWHIPTELPPPLHRIQGDICGPINPPSNSFWYLLVLIDASGNHLEVALLTTRNIVFSRILAILLRYKNHFREYLVKYLWIHNALEFRSHTFEDYCTASGLTSHTLYLINIRKMALRKPS